jgi:AGCS family alanine or glycine:cation symporter
MYRVLEAINSAVWGIPLLALMLGVGIYLSIRTKFVQFRLLPRALKGFWRQFRGNGYQGTTSSYRALCTALAATVGTGNLAGVAGALGIAGPGAIFWMWICALVGMATKFAEATLAVRYRQKGRDGEYYGGPMYMIQNGLDRRWRVLAYVYCFFGLVASFGVGNATQINTVIGGLESVALSVGQSITGQWKIIIGLLLAVLLAYMLLGGAKRIGEATELLIPFVSIGYIVLCLIVLFAFFSTLYKCKTDFENQSEHHCDSCIDNLSDCNAEIDEHLTFCFICKKVGFNQNIIFFYNIIRADETENGIYFLTDSCLCRSLRRV